MFFVKVSAARLDWFNNRIIRVVSPFPHCNIEKKPVHQVLQLAFQMAPFQVILAAWALAFQFHAWRFHYITILRAL